MKRLFAGCIALLLAPAATAGPMMPAGPSPDPGLAGVWRVVGAATAPWVKPRVLAKADASLLEYAVEFADGEVKGPPPLMCTGARYSSGVTYRDELFGGKLSADTDGTLTRKVALTGVGDTTFRVFCGQRAVDLYRDDHGALVMAQGDVVYTLQRREGDGGYTAGFSGPSFDCTQARSTGEQLVCTDAALSKADQVLSRAYAALRMAETPESFATLRTAERAWLSYALKSCGAEKALPGPGGERNRITECLTEEYDARGGLLKDLKVERAGAMTIEPRMRLRTRASPYTEETDVYPWMNGGARATVFNAFVFKTLALDHWRTDDRKAFGAGEDFGDMHLFGRRTYSVARWDDRIVSLQISTDDFTGGNHDALDRTSVTWDLVENRQVRLGDIFSPGRDWQDFAFDFCKRDLHRQMQERGTPDFDDAEIRAAVASGGSWLWGVDTAQVIFMADFLAGAPGGEFDVEIPLKALVRFMKPEAPVR
ncbi:MAG: lysozyme inhibitor LprI family protein [Caulobacteraceae bacterium]|nr:lysozyme inhibitor LprI family protein [Caulobacteraceae bacterium]